MTTMYLVRHAQAAPKFAEVISQENPPVLTDVGEQQVATLAEKLKDIHFTHIYTSPLIRAKQTASYLGQKLNIPVTEDIDLEEMSIPHTDDEVLQKVQEMSSVRRTEEEKFTLKYFDDSESQYDMAQRMQKTLEKYALAYPDETILVVSHGQIMCSLAVLLGYGTVSEVRQSGLENTGYFILQVTPDQVVLKETHGLVNKII